ncbi:probable serine/threonine-protein kinase PBL5 [Cornus florida]|uniref:probable serine/threonine-protein kinase PBL5 n=1 Tax=Cornus florida TaxID=4283 RepID=UPI00289ED697|nr:probable serine/threonine-protein kinase PBL5 [Cornus florida]
MEAQSVVVIQDASREVSSNAIRWALHGLSLKPGDRLTLLSVLHQVNNPSTLSYIGAAKPMGFKSRVDASIFGANHRIVDEEIARKKKEYQNNVELIQIAKLYELKKIGFKIEVDAGPSPKIFAVEAAMKLGATWVILDRKMKKDKKYFLEKLSCGISRMKQNNHIEQLRGKKVVGIKKFPTERSRTLAITYGEMLSGGQEEEDLFSIELFPSHGSTKSTSSTSSEEKCIACLRMEESSGKTNKETTKQVHLDTSIDKQVMGSTEAYRISQDQQPTLSIDMEDLMGTLMPEVIFDASNCTICKNRRPEIGLKRDFTYAELQAATNEFSPENVIYEGGYGAVFRGRLEDVWTIAVKEYKDSNLEGEKKFKSEVQALGKTRHKNLVMLLGSCSEGSHRLLVYEYVCNGSLDQHLKKCTCRTLTWEERMKIALGASRGLKHLHENNIIHRDMKPNNILVTHDYEPLIGGFGVARTQDDSDQSSDDKVIGTFGYLAPEYAECGKSSTKADVYSFGVVLLELITGRSTTDKRLKEKSLLGWARPLLKEKKYAELIDPCIVNSHNCYQFIWMVQVAEKCLSKDPLKRPSMYKVVSAIENIMEGRTPWGIEAEELTNAKLYTVTSVPIAYGFRGCAEKIVQNCTSSDVQRSMVTSQATGILALGCSATIMPRGSNASASRSPPQCSPDSNNKSIRAKPVSVKSVSYAEMLN